MNILYSARPLLLGIDSVTQPSLPGVLTTVNTVQCIKKPNGKIASLNPTGNWEERDPSQMQSPTVNFWEHCTMDSNLNVLIYRYTDDVYNGLVYRVAFCGQ